jgi:CMP/dCMP kinase
MSRATHRIRVAIDGPAGVGKTTTALALAHRLGLLYVDTGAMYRALAVLAARAGISPDDADASAQLARRVGVRLERDASGALRVHADGQDVTDAIRTPEASDGASRISVHPGVRTELVGWQRALAESGGVVMEGRDIGTVVLPDAEAKVFLTASTGERARRRHRELAARGVSVSLSQVLREIEERDARDQGREASPLRPAPDAVVVDCTAFDLNEQVAAVQRVVEALVAPPRKARSRRRSA